MTQPSPSIEWHPRPGDLVEVRTAYDKWVPAIAESGVEGTHVGGRKVHDFPVVWVMMFNGDADLPWPAEDVRRAEVPDED